MEVQPLLVALEGRREIQVGAWTFWRRRRDDDPAPRVRVDLRRARGRRVDVTLDAALLPTGVIGSAFEFNNEIDRIVVAVIKQLP